MKCVLIMGSHRPKGNTAFVTRRIEKMLIEEGHEVTYVDVNTLNIKACIDCTYCRDNLRACVLKDDMTDLYASLLQADMLLMATPVYFNHVSSKLKTIIDRFQMCFMCEFAHQTTFRDRNKGNGFLLSVGGPRAYKDQFVGIELTGNFVFRYVGFDMNHHFKLSGTDHSGLADRPEEIEAINHAIKGVLNV